MVGAAYYRDEARRCRKMATAAKTIEARRRWAELADEYEQLAASLERAGRMTAKPMPMRQQPVQQQQGKQKTK